MRVIAIIAAYNEADVVETVVTDLIEQGVEVYFLDDGSTDGTVELVEGYLGHGVVGIEHLSETLVEASRESFHWERILRRKAQLATELEADWFIHHDADEFRESPWLGESLRSAIARVDALGFNAIDFVCLHFWPDHDEYRPGQDVRKSFAFYEMAPPHDRIQVRCWKRSPVPVDLASTGGHDAQFPDRNVFPIRFLLRHYPVRGQAQGERKIFTERTGRFLDSELAKGWHVQYDRLTAGMSLIRDRSTLTEYDAVGVRNQLWRHPRELDAMAAELESLRRDADALTHRLDQLRHELEVVTVDSTRVSALAEQLTHDNDGLRRELASSTATITSLNARVTSLNGTVTSLHKTIEDGNSQLAETRAQISEKAEQLASTKAQLEGVYRSLSWRWTAPARVLGTLLRRA